MNTKIQARGRFAALGLAAIAISSAKGEVWQSFAGRLDMDEPVRFTLEARAALSPWRMMSTTGMTSNEDGSRNFSIAADNAPNVAGCFSAGGGTMDGVVWAEWSFTPSSDVKMEMYGLMGDLNISDYGGGTVVVDGESVSLPVAGVGRDIRRQSVRAISLSDAEGGKKLSFTFKNPVDLFIQYWGTRAMSFRLIVPPDERPHTYSAGVPGKISFSLSGAGRFRKTVLEPVTLAPGKDWLPFEVPRTIIPGSALDFSDLRPSGKPAGKYGRVVSKGPSFEFEKLPGRPQRFYGVNLCDSANFPATLEDARRMARTLAQIGYNTVRLHHHDSLCVDKRDLQATRLDEAKMKCMDALIAACTEEGLYISTDLFVSRTRTPIAWRSIGVDRDGTVSMREMKRTAPIHEGAYSNYLAFARNWLNHVNVYTKRRYADEPAIAWISLINEGDLDEVTRNVCISCPGWREAWEKWLAAKKKEEPAAYSDITFEIPNGLGRDRQGRAFLRFLQDVETRFISRTRKFLRELGCKALVTDMNDAWGCTAAFGVLREKLCDYVDVHYYVDHPRFLEKSWQRPSWCPNENPFKGERAGAATISAVRMLNRPFTISEYNFSGPGQFRGVGGIAIGAEAALQDWSGLWRFAWSHGLDAALNVGTRPSGYFDIASDPLQLASERASVCIFLRGDVEPLDRTYAVTLPLEKAMSHAFKTGLSSRIDWVWAAWLAKIGAVCGPAAPDGAIHAGDFESAYTKLSSEVRKDLSVPSGDVIGSGAVRIDRRRGTFMVDSQRTCGAFAESGEVSGANFRVRIAGAPATVWASSLDGLPLEKSGRILVTHLTDVQNSGAEYADREMCIQKTVGHLPYLMRSGVADVSIRVSGTGHTVYSLDSSGARRGVVRSILENGRIGFTCDTGMCAGVATYLYEIVKE